MLFPSLSKRAIFAEEYNAGVKDYTTIYQRQHLQYVKNLFDFSIQNQSKILEADFNTFLII